MKTITLFTLLGAILCGVLFKIYHIDLLFTLTVTFSVTCYHISIRLLIGAIIDRLFHNKMDYHHKWFREKSFEPTLYKKLKVKQWKNKMPTYSPASFSIKEHSLTEIIDAINVKMKEIIIKINPVVNQRSIQFMRIVNKSNQVQMNVLNVMKDIFSSMDNVMQLKQISS